MVALSGGANGDGVQYSFDPSELAAAAAGTSGNVTLASDGNDDQRLIRVYQTSMEDNDNKLITVYEIKPDSLDGSSVASIGGDHEGNGAGGRDVLVEIVSAPEGGGMDNSSGINVALTEPPGNLHPLPPQQTQIMHQQLQGGQTLQFQPQLQSQPKRGILSPEELQAQLGQRYVK